MTRRLRTRKTTARDTIPLHIFSSRVASGFLCKEKHNKKNCQSISLPLVGYSTLSKIKIYIYMVKLSTVFVPGIRIIYLINKNTTKMSNWLRSNKAPYK